MASKTRKVLETANGKQGSRAILYVRTTPEDTSVPPLTLQRQLLESWCAEYEISPTETFEDNCADDAPLSKRTGLAKALNALAENKCQVLVALTSDRFTSDEFDGVVIETLANERYGAELWTQDGPCDWGDAGASAREVVAKYINAARAIDDARQNDDNPDDWNHIQTAANLAIPRLSQDPAKKGLIEKPSLMQISDWLAERDMVSKHGSPYAPIQVSRMLEKFEKHRIELKIKEKAYAEQLAGAKA